jgi:hypothetical protein
MARRVDGRVHRGSLSAVSRHSRTSASSLLE